MLFRTLLAPFVRGLAPKGWVVPLIMGVSAVGQFITGQRQQGRYRREVDEARHARGQLFQHVAPRLHGAQGIPPNILYAAGRGLPPAPPPQTNLFSQAMQIAGAYAPQLGGGPPTGDEAGALPTTPPGAGEVQAQLGTPPAADPAAAAATQQTSMGAGAQPAGPLFRPEQLYALG